MSKEKLIAEEQHILNEFIAQIDDLIKDKEEDRTDNESSIDKDSLTPEAYGEILTRAYRAKVINADISNLIVGKDALYEYRMNLSYICSDGTEGIDEFKITKISLLDNSTTVLWGKDNDPLMLTWLNPNVRPYILDPELIDYTQKIQDEYKRETITNFHLELKRKLDIRFARVKNVDHMYPLTIEETEKIIGDIFLAELAKKRANSEFTDIIFSIQKQQGEIINQKFEKNIIVQGCAGSGKSMIMLHRLPVLLYDNLVSRSNVYIISPSQSYIQLVNNMRRTLEIYDIAMGTLNDYYESAISRYKLSEKPYKTISTLDMPWSIAEYFYSDNAITDIDDYYLSVINRFPYEIKTAYKIFDEKPKSTRDKSPNGELSNRIINLSNILAINRKVIHEMFKATMSYLSAMRSFNTTISQRIKSIISTMNLSLEKHEKDRIREQKEIEKLKKNNRTNALANRIKKLNDIEKNIDTVQNDIEIIKQDTEYSQYIGKLCHLAQSQIDMFDFLDPVFEKNEMESLYKIFDMYQDLAIALKEMNSISSVHEDKYLSYHRKDINKDLKHISALMKEINSANKPKLSYPLYMQLTEWFKYYSELSTEIISDAYFHIIDKSGYQLDEKQRNIGLSCSPYILLRLLYSYYGKPNSHGEDLIAIDEAQNLASNEYRLIKAVNHNKLVFNVFGDIKQHVEDTKGLNSWSEIDDYKAYSLFELNDNYRNASQITEYCNSKFNMTMRPINLSGIGVSEFYNFSDFSEHFKTRMRKLSGAGLSAIIVANSDEAKDIKNKFDIFGSSINDITGELSVIYENKWNLMTVGQAKGLEFNCAIAIITNMTANEKYIACTRALDEMIVYCGEYSVKNSTIIEEESDKSITALKKDNTYSKRSEQINNITISPENQKFFEDAGLKVIDERNVGGDLWLIGNKEKTRAIIMTARSRYRINSIQYGEKSPGVYGWHTKSKNV